MNVFHQDMATATMLSLEQTRLDIRTDLAHVGKKRYDSEERQSFSLWLLIDYLSEHTLQTDYVSN